MCGRYTETKVCSVLTEHFRDFIEESLLDDFRPRFNISPGQDTPVILNDRERVLDLVRWGLVPFWAKDEKTGYKMINARAETLTVKPAYRKLIEKRRCLVLADGFYEWKKGGNVKAPHRFIVNDGEPFAFAGLWERWRRPDQSELRSFTIITTEPNRLVRFCHDRMPVILPRSACEQWLDPEFTDLEKLQKLLQPYPDTDMKAYPVSVLVNNPRNDDPQCVEPARAQ